MILQNAEEFYNSNKIEKKEQDRPFYEYFRTVYSQFGEDGILEAILKKLNTENNYYVEFGAGNGIHISNTAYLRINKNWNGLLLEGDINKIPVDSSINLHHEMVYSDNINYLFEKYNVPSKFGLLSVDIDGDDAYVLDEIDLNRFSPDVIIVEFNPGLPNHIGIKIKEQKSNLSNGDLHERGYIGCNLRELYNILENKSYKFVTTVSVNAIFVKSELFNLLDIEDLSKEEIMSIHSYPSGYDDWKSYILKYNDDWIITNK